MLSEIEEYEKGDVEYVSVKFPQAKKATRVCVAIGGGEGVGKDGAVDQMRNNIVSRRRGAEFTNNQACMPYTQERRNKEDTISCQKDTP